MATTFYEGKLESTKHWPEATDDFNAPICAGKTAFDLLCEALVALEKGEAKTSTTGDWFWIQPHNYWIRITKEGVIEIGEAG